MEPTVNYLKSIGTSERSIREFKKWNKKKKPKRKKFVKKKEKKIWEEPVESFGENEVASFLGRHDIDFETEKTFKGLVSKKGGSLRFDFYLPEHKCLIEYDGAHHFKKVAYCKNPKEVQQNDKKKDSWCLRNKVPLLRVRRQDLKELKQIIFYFIENLKK